MFDKIFGALTGGGVKETVETVGSIIDQFIESDDEIREDENKKAAMQDLRDKVQVAINAIEAKSKSFWKSGWRPGFGWLCLVIIAHDIVIRDHLIALGYDMPPIDEAKLDFIYWMAATMLGLGGGIRTIEKIRGLTK